ncbi:LOW QUALITY PROTEIN: striated muscle preferentially expressed protein kinase-like, partial [Leucoraja erinacea]|uniref:LOW QUALITY PROTEIN: striated muscle preferentially expressed protein kinase-like n=1 Tax=Leucoraja erinaceus TaxID=7782 RepID=UPI0024580279
DDKELLESSHLSFVYEDSECSLVILNTAPADSGVYTCTARNLAGDVSCKAELTVVKGKAESEETMDDEDTILRKMRLLTDYYDIHHEIGRGAFACVKQVTEKSSTVDYAAKLISFRATPRDQAVRELHILSQLDHERVVYFHDAFEKKNTLTIVMELCPQEELFDRLIKKPAVLETEVRYYVQQILEGIRYLHQNNILHLDIKPDNILVAHPGSDSLRICDFGNALELTPDTPQYSRLGTPEYVAPEIIAQTPVSTATDVWPVGVIAYIGLTGVSPFSGENDRSTLLNVKNYNVAFEEKMFADLSRESKGFVTSLLVEDKHRPSAEDCLHHVWFLSVDTVKGKMINTDPLKSLVSRRKWQRSLISYKSSMVVRSIPEVLADASGPPSLGLPRQLRDPRLSSSSDSDEIDELPLLPMPPPTPPEFRASRLPLHHLRGQALAEAQAQTQAQTQARAQEEQERAGPEGVPAGDQGPTQAPSEGGTETEMVPQAPHRPGPKAPARKRPPEAEPSDSSDEEAPPAARGHSSEAADWPPAQRHSSASRRRGEFRRGSSADSALALLGAGESLGLEAGTGAQLSPAGGGLKKSVSMELPRRSPSPSPRRPEEGPGGRRRAGPASEDYSLKLELLRQRLLRGGSVDNKMSGLRGPLLERLGLPDGEPQHLGPLPFERQALRPPRPDKQSRLARAASSDSAPTQDEPERRALRKTASFSQAEPPTLHRRLGAPLEIPLQPASPRAPSPEQFPLKESPSLSALTDPHSRPVTPVRASRPQEARPLTPHILVVPAPEEADGPCTRVMIGRTAVVTHSNLTSDPKPEPPSITARTDPILELTRPKPNVDQARSPPTVELTRPKPILGQARPDPTLHLTRPKPMLGQAKPQPTVDQARLKTTLELARPDPTLDLTRPKPMLGQARPEHTSGQTRPQRPLDLSRPQLTVELTRPKPTAGQARSQPIVELMRPKPILGLATPDPTLDLTRPKPMLGQAKPQPTVDQARLKTTLEQARPDPTLVLTRPQLSVDQAGPQPTLHQTGLEPPLPLPATEGPATEGPRIEVSGSRPVPKPAEPPGSLPLREGRSPATVQQVGPVPPCEPATITPPPGFRSTDGEEEKEGLQARLGPEAWESGARVPPVKEKASSVAQCLNIDNMESEEVFEARFKRSKESSLSRSLKQLIRPRSEEKMEQAARPGELRYRPGATGQPLQLPKAQDATTTNHQQAASRSRSEQNIPEASKDHGFMRKLSLRLKGGPADEGKEEEEEAGGPSKKKGPKSSPGLTVRRKIESTISGISLRFGRSQSEERVQETPAGQSPGPTQREAKESKRPFLSLLRRSTSEAGSLKRVGIPQNQLATQTRSTPSTESLQSDTSLPTKQDRGSVQGERKSRWDRWGFSRMKRDKAISQPNISLAVAAEESSAPYHRSASDFPPVFHVKLKDQSLLEGEPLTLCSLPAGSPTPTVTWIKDDCPVASDERVMVVACADGRQLVTLLKTTRADVGVYVCTAANPLGTASSTCSVSLARLPGPPGAPEIPQTYKNTALVLWKAADTPGPCTYTLEYQRTGDGSWIVLGSGITDCFYNATELMEGSLSFRVACVNKAGLGPYSRNSGPIHIEGDPPAQRVSESSPPTAISPVPVYAAKVTSVAISPPVAPTRRPPTAVTIPPAPSHYSSSLSTAVTAITAKPGVSPASAPMGGPSPAKPSLYPAPAPKGGPIPSPSLSPARPGPSVTPSRLSPTSKVADASGTGLRHGIPQKPYTFMEEKARGRFGVVRECKENSTGKVFMAKIVHYEGENKQSVLQEYEVLKALHHDKVMCLHEAYVTPRYLVLISENCRGKEILYSLIDRFRYSEDDVVCYVQQMLQGLDYLHGRHIVHLDVKPDNVMVTYLNVVKLVDFGSAHFFNPTVPRCLAQRAGTHEYMSPEMVMGDPIGPPADIWGLGVLTYIMLSGRSPFLAPEPDETETRIKSAHFDLTKCYPNASQNAAHFIKRVLCMFPASRPTVRECVSNPWLQDNYLMKLRRQTLTFTTTRLKEFLVHHQRRRGDTLTRHRVLLRTYSATPPDLSP